MQRDGVPDIRVQGLTKRYGDVVAVDGIDLDIPAGEFFTMLGPSGSGKTTTLRMIAGFVNPTEGLIRIGGQDFTHLPPEKRAIGIVFQNYAIFPHMDVFNNIAYGLKVRKVPTAEIAERVTRVLATVGLSGYERNGAVAIGTPGKVAAVCEQGRIVRIRDAGLKASGFPAAALAAGAASVWGFTIQGPDASSSSVSPTAGICASRIAPGIGTP